MVRDKLSIVKFILLAITTLVVAACASSSADKEAKASPAALYSDAKDEMNNGQWERAIPILERLEARAAGTPLAQQAQLDKAYAQYKASEQAQALATIERFVKLHPASPALDYALFLRGVINFNDDLGLFSGITGQNLAERDQKASKESFEAFNELVTRFPDSKYAADARQRMNYIVSTLAQSEVHVARYYYKRGAYLAAINRAQTTVSDYRDVPAVEEALFILYKSYDAMGMTQLRDDAKRVMEKNYPNSEFLVSGAKVQKNPWWKFW